MAMCGIFDVEVRIRNRDELDDDGVLDEQRNT
jgi:hypothetical protein